jgi:hypothetical protein
MLVSAGFDGPESVEYAQPVWCEQGTSLTLR